MTRIALLLLALLSVSPAFAADTREKPTLADIRKQPAPERMYLTADELTKVEAMDAPARVEFFKKRNAEFQALDKPGQEKLRAERKAAFDKLPKNQQDTIRARMDKILAAMKTPQRDTKGENTVAAQKAEEFMKNMTPEQKAKWEEIRKNSQKWAEKKK